MKKVVIIGAGPAGITAGYELVKKSKDYDVTIMEATGVVGGIARTVNHNGNLMDLGGHRFFTNSEEVKNWWEEILAKQGQPAKDDRILKRTINTAPGGPDPEFEDDVMLVRKRVSSIHYNDSFLEYPVKFNGNTVKALGFGQAAKAGFSYLESSVFKKKEDNLENYFLNHFGKSLYQSFFEGYTEKLWGRHPSQISAEWGAQRLKGISVSSILKDKSNKKKNPNAVEDAEFGEEFLYPKYGPGQLWNLAARKFTDLGGRIRFRCKVTGIETENNVIKGVRCEFDGQEFVEPADIIISSMPIKELILSMKGVPFSVEDVAKGLPYRDLVVLGLLVPHLKIKNTSKIKTLNGLIPECWIYVQDSSVKVGRIQIYNNWSPYLLQKPEENVWIGLEYSCTEGDYYWNQSDIQWQKLAVEELSKLGILESNVAVLDFNKVMVPKAYPAYFDSYNRFDEIKNFLDNYPNLYCVGRNGQHRYNNMDHCMMTSFETVKTILAGKTDKTKVWNVNRSAVSYHDTTSLGVTPPAEQKARMQQAAAATENGAMIPPNPELAAASALSKESRKYGTAMSLRDRLSLRSMRKPKTNNVNYALLEESNESTERNSYRNANVPIRSNYQEPIEGMDAARQPQQFRRKPSGVHNDKNMPENTYVVNSAPVKKDIVFKTPESSQEPLFAKPAETVVPAPAPVVEEAVAAPAAPEVIPVLVVEPVYEEPAAPAVAEPVYEEPVVEAAAEPVYEEPVAEPVYEEPADEAVAEPVYEEPVAEPVYEEPAVEAVAEPVYEEPIAEAVYVEPVVETVAEPVYEEPAPVAEEYAAPSEEYVAPAEEYVAPAEEYVAPAEEYVAPAEEYVAPAEEYAVPAEEPAVATEAAPAEEADYEENVYEESVVGSGKFNPEEAGSYVPEAEQGETVFTPRYYHEEPVYDEATGTFVSYDDYASYSSRNEEYDSFAAGEYGYEDSYADGYAVYEQSAEDDQVYNVDEMNAKEAAPKVIQDGDILKTNDFGNLFAMPTEEETKRKPVAADIPFVPVAPTITIGAKKEEKKEFLNQTGAAATMEKIEKVMKTEITIKPKKEEVVEPPVQVVSVPKPTYKKATGVFTPKPITEEEKKKLEEEEKAKRPIAPSMTFKPKPEEPKVEEKKPAKKLPRRKNFVKPETPLKYDLDALNAKTLRELPEMEEKKDEGPVIRVEKSDLPTYDIYASMSYDGQQDQYEEPAVSAEDTIAASVQAAVEKEARAKEIAEERLARATQAALEASREEGSVETATVAEERKSTAPNINNIESIEPVQVEIKQPEAKAPVRHVNPAEIEVPKDLFANAKVIAVIKNGVKTTTADGKKAEEEQSVKKTIQKYTSDFETTTVKSIRKLRAMRQEKAIQDITRMLEGTDERRVVQPRPKPVAPIEPAPAVEPTPVVEQAPAVEPAPFVEPVAEPVVETTPVVEVTPDFVTEEAPAYIEPAVSEEAAETTKVAPEEPSSFFQLDLRLKDGSHRVVEEMMPQLDELKAEKVSEAAEAPAAEAPVAEEAPAPKPKRTYKKRTPKVAPEEGTVAAETPAATETAPATEVPAEEAPKPKRTYKKRTPKVTEEGTAAAETSAAEIPTEEVPKPKRTYKKRTPKTAEDGTVAAETPATSETALAAEVPAEEAPKPKRTYRKRTPKVENSEETQITLDIANTDSNTENQ